MEISLKQSSQLKAIAILMMLFLHLFNNEGYLTGLFTAIIYVGKLPLVYYLSLFSDACVPIFAFVSGYGLYFKFTKNRERYNRENYVRIKKLYINYWIILIVFAVLLGFFLNKEGYPGSFPKFLENFTAVNGSYNGAWWFFSTYVLFVMTSTFWYRILIQYNSYVVLGMLSIIYLGAFVLRIKHSRMFDNYVVQLLYWLTVLYFCTLFQFMLGAAALKEKWTEKIANSFKAIKYKNLASFLGILLLIVFHGLFPNLILAPLTGVVFIFLFCQLRLPKQIEKFLNFLAPHATNLWLIHMFFYLIFFSAFIYSPNYVFLIFILLIACCIASSIVINYINKYVLYKLNLK